MNLLHRTKPYPVIILVFCLLLPFAILSSTSCCSDPGRSRPDYASRENWAYYRIGKKKPVDLFLICPTVDKRDEYQMSLDDTRSKDRFLGSLNMQRGLYEDQTRMYAPYYRQAALKVYSLSPDARETYLEYAYGDVSAAFSYYLSHENQGRPFILAGFSQGADMCVRIIKEYFDDPKISGLLVACYAIGWSCPIETVEMYPQIRPAQSADDTGTMISFDCEAPGVEETLINPAGQKACCINPLNWKTDGTPAQRSENLGACFTLHSGEIQEEQTALCGCYIDEMRGVLKVTDIRPADYPPLMDELPQGAYHVYDYKFFYRNLQQNIRNRIEKYLKKKSQASFTGSTAP